MDEAVRLVSCKNDAQRLELQAYLKKEGYHFFGKEIDDKNVLSPYEFIIHTDTKSLAFMGWSAAMKFHQINQPHIKYREFKKEMAAKKMAE